MRRIAVNKAALARRFSRSMATYERAAVVQREMADQLVADLLSVSGVDRFDRVLELGCGTGLLTERILERCRPGCLVLNDLVAECAETARHAGLREPAVTVQFVHGDMETAEFPHPQDLIASSAVVQWAADPEGLLTRMAGLLRRGGVLAVASFGPLNLQEVSHLTGSSLPYKSAEEWRSGLAGRYEVLSVRENVRTLWYSSAREVLQHLKETGVNSPDARPWPPSKTKRFCRAYEAAFGHAGKVPLTYHPVFMVARKCDDGGIGS